MAPSLKLSPVHQKIVNLVAALSSQDSNNKAPRKQVMTMSGYPPKNTGFKIALSTLKTKKQCLTYDSETIVLTNLGRSVAEPVEVVLPSNEDNMAKLRDSLKGNKAKMIFDALIDGRVHSREAIAIAVGYDEANCSGFRVAISQLASKDLMKYCEDNNGEPGLQLTDLVFPFGRPDASDE